MDPVDVCLKIRFVMINERQYVELSYIRIDTGVLVHSEVFPYEQD